MFIEYASLHPSPIIPVVTLTVDLCALYLCHVRVRTSTHMKANL